MTYLSPKTYLDPQKTRFAKITEIKGPALLIPHERPEDLLFVGGGEDPFACLLTGEWKGEGFRTRTVEDWEGLAIEDVKLEVDLSSVVSPDRGEKRLLTAVRRGTTVGLFIKHKERGFPQTITCDVSSDLPAGSSDTRVGFTRWRLIVEEGDEKIEIYACDLDATGPS